MTEPDDFTESVLRDELERVRAELARTNGTLRAARAVIGRLRDTILSHGQHYGLSERNRRTVDDATALFLAIPDGSR